MQLFYSMKNSTVVLGPHLCSCIQKVPGKENDTKTENKVPVQVTQAWKLFSKILTLSALT